MRNQSEGLRSKNEVILQRRDYVRREEDQQMEERRRQYDRINSQRAKRLRTELDEQSYNFEVYKYDKLTKQEKIDRQKALIQNANEKQQEALREKIEKQRDTLEQQRDQIKFSQLMKQELRKLKQQDQNDLTMHQQRIKLKQKVNVAAKKIQSD